MREERREGWCDFSGLGRAREGRVNKKVNSSSSSSRLVLEEWAVAGGEGDGRVD